jgi:CHASE3 domain sensor protein/anti-anti-sigma regulatory factor
MSFFQHLRIRTKILIGATLVLLIVVSMSGLVYHGILVSQTRDQAVAHTMEIISAIDDVQLQITNMEAGYRGFLIVGDDTFLGPYTTGYQSYSRTYARLRELVGDDPRPFDQLIQIDRAVQRWHNGVLESGIQIRRLINGTNNAALTAFTNTDSTGRHAFEDLRARVAALRAVEAEHSAAQRQEAEVAALNLQTTLWIGSGLAIVASLGLLGLLATRLARRVGVVTQAAVHMADGERTARCNLPPARDEVGQLAAAFNTMAAIIEQHTTDLQTQYVVADAARREAESAHAQVADQLAVITAQQAVIRDMSVPVLPLSPTTLVMPLVGALDSARLGLLHTQALQALEQTAARQLLLDITGVPVVDTQVAQGLLQLVQMARLMGADVDIVGVRPEVAQTIVSLGLNLSEIRTHSSLQQGIGSLL